jgi:hypothetical protein
VRKDAARFFEDATNIENGAGTFVEKRCVPGQTAFSLGTMRAANLQRTFRPLRFQICHDIFVTVDFSAKKELQKTLPVRALDQNHDVQFAENSVKSRMLCPHTNSLTIQTFATKTGITNIRQAGNAF